MNIRFNQRLKSLNLMLKYYIKRLGGRSSKINRLYDVYYIKTKEGKFIAYIISNRFYKVSPLSTLYHMQQFIIRAEEELVQRRDV